MISTLLEEPYLLRPDQVASYQRDGHIMLQGVGTPELAGSLRPPLQLSVASVMAKKDPQGRIEQYGGMFQQVTNVWRLDPTLRQFIFAKRFAKIAADLMGVAGVRLYHDQALFKPPGGKGTPWHQDQFYWPLETTHTLTMWMPLVDVDDKTGSMVFASGSHVEGPLLDKAISTESDTYFDELIPKRGFHIATGNLRAGDATFHSGWTVHSAHANTSTRMREVITIIYYADGTKIMEPDTKFRQVDMEAFHPGQKPGELAASELNPLLFKT